MEYSPKPEAPHVRFTTAFFFSLSDITTFQDILKNDVPLLAN